MRRYLIAVLLLFLSASFPARATVFATVRGVVHDPQHRPVAGAQVMLKAVDSDFSLHTETDTTASLPCLKRLLAFTA